MAKAASEPVTLKPQGRNLVLPQGGQVAILEKGVETYRRLRAGGTVLVDIEGQGAVECQIVGVSVGALIDLISNSGSTVIQAYGRPYSALNLIQALTEASPDDVLDVTELYTAVSVIAPIASRNL